MWWSLVMGCIKKLMPEMVSGPLFQSFHCLPSDSCLRTFDDDFPLNSSWFLYRRWSGKIRIQWTFMRTAVSGSGRSTMTNIDQSGRIGLSVKQQVNKMRYPILRNFKELHKHLSVCFAILSFKQSTLNSLFPFVSPYSIQFNERWRIQFNFILVTMLKVWLQSICN